MSLNVTIVNQPSIADPSAMVSLRDTLDHVLRLQRKIDRLCEARDESLAAAAEIAARANMGRPEAESVYGRLQEADIPGRSEVVTKGGWHPQRIYRGVWPPVGQPCVYLLRNGPHVIYVGRSVNPQSRIGPHRRSGKVFDAVDLWVCRDEEEMICLEADLIHQHYDSLENQRREEVLL